MSLSHVSLLSAKMSVNLRILLLLGLILIARSHPTSHEADGTGVKQEPQQEESEKEQMSSSFSKFAERSSAKSPKNLHAEPSLSTNGADDRKEPLSEKFDEKQTPSSDFEFGKSSNNLKAELSLSPHRTAERKELLRDEPREKESPQSDSESAEEFEKSSALPPEYPTDVRNEDVENEELLRQTQPQKPEKLASENQNNVESNLIGIFPRLQTALRESQQKREVQVAGPKPLTLSRSISNDQLLRIPVESLGGPAAKDALSYPPTIFTPSQSIDQNNYLWLGTPSPVQNRWNNSPVKLKAEELGREESPRRSQNTQRTSTDDQNDNQIIIKDEMESKKIYNSNVDENDTFSSRINDWNESRSINDPAPKTASSPTMENAAAQLTEFDKILRFQNSAKVMDVSTLVSAVAKLSPEELVQAERYVRKLAEQDADSPLKPLFSFIEFMLQNQELMRTLNGNLPPSLLSSVGQMAQIPGAFVAGVLDLFVEAGHSALNVGGTSFTNMSRLTDVGFENGKDLAQYIMQVKEKFPIIGDAMIPLDDVLKILINTSHAAIGDTLESVGNSLNKVADDGRVEAALARQKRSASWPSRSSSFG